MEKQHDYGDLLEDDHGSYRLVSGKKIYQIEEKTQEDVSLNQAINDYRSSGHSSPGAYLRSLYT